jgi:hypothetical protein
MAPCPSCGSPVQSDLPFCGKCGKRLTTAAAGRACPNCGRPNDQGFAFCPACGTAIAGSPPEPASPFQLATKKVGKGAELLLLDRGGATTQRYPLLNAVTTIGRQGADINFPDDGYLSPVHAQFLLLDGILSVRTWAARTAPGSTPTSRTGWLMAT